jgi:hypothetical protein
MSDLHTVTKLSRLVSSSSRCEPTTISLPSLHSSSNIERESSIPPPEEEL